MSTLKEKGLANGYAPLDASAKVPAEHLPASQGGGAAWGEITGTLADQADLQAAIDAKADSDHDHDATYAAAIHNHDSDYAPLVHDHDGTYATAAHNHDAAYSAIDHDHDGTYEPADADIQTHIASAHAPSDAQKNSDITKAEIEAKLTGEISSHSHAGGPGGEAFPVGSVFIAVVSTNPGTLLGYGTWEAFAAGRMLVGFNAGDADFDAVEETGGAKTSSAVVNHTHDVTITDPGHVHVENSNNATTGGLRGWGAADTSTNTSTATGYSTASAVTGVTAATANPSGGVASFSLMNPWITVHMWKRTA